MFKNYLKITSRFMRRQKLYSFINISGLSIGMACCILILFYVKHELSYDDYHKNSDRIYRIAIDAQLGGQNLRMPKSSPRITSTMESTYPEVEKTVMLSPFSRKSVSYKDQLFYEDNVLFAGEKFFEIFTFDFIIGSPKNALDEPYEVVITEEIAVKYFGAEDPVGKQLLFDNNTLYTVSGVIKNVPSNSHFTFDFVRSFKTIYENPPQNINEFFYINYYTYFLLKEGYSIKELENKVQVYIQQNLALLIPANLRGGKLEIFFQPLQKIYLHSDLEQDIGITGSIVNVYIFSVIAVIILITASINFMNLSAARSFLRLREIGMRKVLGADRKKIAGQFLFETAFYSILSFFVALVIVWIASPFLNSIAEKEISFNIFGNLEVIPIFTGLIFVTALVSGGYPAFFPVFL